MPNVFTDTRISANDYPIPAFSKWFRLRVCAVYAIAAILWIIMSDSWLAMIVGQSPALLAQFGSLKGIGFVAITTLALYSVLSVELRRRSTVEKALQEDIIQRKQIEAARLQLAAIVEASDDSIVSTTPTGTIKSWNQGAEQIYGYCASEVIGKTVQSLFPENIVAEIDNLFTLVMQGRSISHFVTQRTRKDGRVIDVSLTISPIYDAEHRIVAIAAIGRDITEQKRATERIIEAERMETEIKKEREILNLKSEINHMVSDEFRTPLTVITLATELLTGYGDKLPPEKVEKKLREILTEADHMSDLLDGIRALSDTLDQPPVPDSPLAAT